MEGRYNYPNWQRQIRIRFDSTYTPKIYFADIIQKKTHTLELIWKTWSFMIPHISSFDGAYIMCQSKVTWHSSTFLHLFDWTPPRRQEKLQQSIFGRLQRILGFSFQTAITSPRENAPRMRYYHRAMITRSCVRRLLLYAIVYRNKSVNGEWPYIRRSARQITATKRKERIA